MEKRIILKNGEKYPLKDFFSGINEKIIIPDLQRDYCWGGTSLVGNFIDSLFDLDKTTPITLGLIYGYIDDNLIADHLQLCDGQQRLTTIFLLLGQLYRLTGQESIKDHLISDFELNNDDREPYLLYSIRESSIYFLSDLTYNYFIERDAITSVDEIAEQPWYLDSYDQDPSIRSILAALEDIETRLDGQTTEALVEFADFLLNNVEFLYVDMSNRENGEETFVVINTTGEPLSSNQNLKPRMIRANPHLTDIASRWEKMENWFWKNRYKSGSYEHTSDEGFDIFIGIVKLLQSTSESDYISRRTDIPLNRPDDNIQTQVKSDNFPLENIDFNTIEKCFNAYSRICLLEGFDKRFDDAVRPRYENGFSEERLFVLLPTMQYIIDHPDCIDEDILRVFHIMHNAARYLTTAISQRDKTAPAYRAFTAIKSLTTADPFEIADLHFFSEERIKLLQLRDWLKNADLTSCQPIEKTMAEIESHPIFNGKISTFITWASANMNEFKKYVDRFFSYWNPESGELNSLRRALLCHGLTDYPLQIPGKNIHTFCTDPKDWYSVINNNVDTIKEMLDSNLPVESIIDREHANAGYFERLVLEPTWWNLMERGNVSILTHDLYILLQKERTSADYTIIFHNEPFNRQVLGNDWNYIWRYPDSTGLYCDHTKYDVTIDIEPADGSKFRLVVHRGKNPSLDYFHNLHIIARRFNLRPYQRYDCAFATLCDSIRDIKSLAIDIANRINYLVTVNDDLS